VAKHKPTSKTNQEQKARARQKAHDKERAQKDREYTKRLKALEKVGAYAPKSAKITKYRKTRINKAWSWYSPLLDKNSFFFIPTGKRGKQVIQRAANLDMITTVKGIFFQKPKGAVKATLQTKGKEPRIKIKSYKEDAEGWRVREEYIPLVPTDALEKELERWRKEADRLAPIHIDQKQRIAFKVTEKDHEGFSRKIFHTIDDMIRYMQGYKHAYGDRVKFFRHITIVKTTTDKWFKDHPLAFRREKDRKRFERKSRR
jgi:hypothetical protein